jgi:hypothetical protein
MPLSRVSSLLITRTVASLMLVVLMSSRPSPCVRRSLCRRQSSTGCVVVRGGTGRERWDSIRAPGAGIAAASRPPRSFSDFDTLSAGFADHPVQALGLHGGESRNFGNLNWESPAIA